MLRTREEKEAVIKKRKDQWKEQIQETLRSMDVKQDAIENIQIVLTTHTAMENSGDIDWTLYGETNE